MPRQENTGRMLEDAPSEYRVAPKSKPLPTAVMKSCLKTVSEATIYTNLHLLACFYEQM